MIVYSYLRGPSKGKINLPVWLPGYTTSNSSKSHDKSIKNHKTCFQENRKNQEIGSIKGISDINIFKFKQIGINSIDDFLLVASSKVGRNNLARHIGVTPATILKWVNQAEAIKTHTRL